VALASTWYLVHEPDHYASDLPSVIGSAAERAGDGGELILTGVTPFAWDQMYVFGAYTTTGVVRDALGFNWVPTSPLGEILSLGQLMQSDGMELLVFVTAHREVVSWVELNGTRLTKPYLSFATPSGVTVYPATEARFRVRDVTGSLSDPAWPAWEFQQIPAN
jgi:hypothetical protein